MSRRDECLISNCEEATQWLAEFKHTITDEQVLKVIECFQVNASDEFKDLHEQLACKEEIISGLEDDVESLEKQLADAMAE